MDLLRRGGGFISQVAQLLSPQQPPLDVPDSPSAEEWVTDRRVYDSEPRRTTPHTPEDPSPGAQAETEPLRVRPGVGTLLEASQADESSEARQEPARHVPTESEVRQWDQQHIEQEEVKRLATVLADHFKDIDVQHLSRQDSPEAARAVLNVLHRAAASPDPLELAEPPEVSEGPSSSISSVCPA